MIAFCAIFVGFLAFFGSEAAKCEVEPSAAVENAQPKIVPKSKLSRAFFKTARVFVSLLAHYTVSTTIVDILSFSVSRCTQIASLHVIIFLEWCVWDSRLKNQDVRILRTSS